MHSVSLQLPQRKHVHDEVRLTYFPAQLLSDGYSMLALLSESFSLLSFDTTDLLRKSRAVQSRA